MSSAINPSLPKDGVPASKADLRANLLAAKTEIEALQAGGAGVPMPVGDASGVVNVKAFGAKGNGVDDTRGIQRAIDSAPSGSVVYLPPGSYGVSMVRVPHNKALTIRGASPWATVIRGLETGLDLFRVTDPKGATVQNRMNTVHWYDNLGFKINTGNDGDDLTPGLNRCTTAGMPVGPCAIAYVTDYVPSSATPHANETWLHSFGLVTNCLGGITRKHGAHGCGLIHHGGNHYGWTYQNIWCEGVHYGITDSFPWARRVTSRGGDRLSLVNGGNPYGNNKPLFVAAHAPWGKVPSGLRRFTTYWTVNSNGNSFQLSDRRGGSPVSFSAEGGALYVYAAEGFASEYAPDGISVDRLTFYGGRCPISMTNTENLHIGRVDSYGCVAPLHLHGLKSKNRAEHIGVVVDAYYSESPQSGVQQPGEDSVHINTVGGNIGYLQVRGATKQQVRPVTRLKGLGYTVQNLEFRSSHSQAQPRLEIEGSGIGVYGLVHGGAQLADVGKDNHYLLKNMSADGWRFKKSPW